VADLVVNTENLRNLANQLATVHGTLTAADGDARDLAGMIPHAGLASAVDKFTSGWDQRRKDLADRVDQLQKRADGSALSAFANELERAQQQAAGAIAAHNDAQRRHAYAQRNLSDAHTAAHQTVDPTELQEATDAARRYSSMSTTAAADLTNAQASYDAAVAAVAEAGDTAAAAISHAASSDGLNDSWWDNVLDWVNENAEWIKAVKDVLTLVTVIVGALSIFFPVLAPIALGLAILSAGLSFLLASSGDGSWLDFALDVVGVLSFGLGGAALGGIKLGTSALRGGRAATLAVRSPGMVWGNGAREVVGNLLERGLVGSIRQPMKMVAEESASVLAARPNLLQVAGRWGDESITAIRESDSIIIKEFDQIASQAKLGAGGPIDRLITGGVDNLKGVVKVTGTIGEALDRYNLASIAVNRVGEAVTGASPDGSPLHQIGQGVVDIWNIPQDLTTHAVVDWSVHG